MRHSDPTRPALWVLCGLPGSGKSTLGRRLEAEHGVVRLCPDEWLHELGLADRGWAARGAVERLQKQLAERLLSAGIDVAVEDGFWLRIQRDEMRALAEHAGADAVVVFLDEPLDELWRRIEHRNGSPATFTVTRAELEDWAGWLEPPADDEPAVRDDEELRVVLAARLAA